MTKRDITRLSVLAFSFFSVSLVEWLDFDYDQYYLSLAFTSLCVVWLSCQFEDKILFIYALIQTLSIGAYTGLLTENYLFYDWLIYLAPFNLRIIVLSYELAILVMSGGAGVFFAIRWLFNGIMRRGNHYSSFDKVK